MRVLSSLSRIYVYKCDGLNSLYERYDENLTKFNKKYFFFIIFPIQQ